MHESTQAQNGYDVNEVSLEFEYQKQQLELQALEDNSDNIDTLFIYVIVILVIALIFLALGMKRIKRIITKICPRSKRYLDTSPAEVDGQNQQANNQSNGEQQNRNSIQGIEINFGDHPPSNEGALRNAIILMIENQNGVQ